MSSLLFLSQTTTDANIRNFGGYGRISQLNVLVYLCADSTIFEMKHIFLREKIASLRPDSIVLYNRYPNCNRSRREKTDEELQNLEKGKNGKYNGYMSKPTSRKCKKYISNWINSISEAKKRFNRKVTKTPTFVTLTLPSKQKHTDNELKRHCLNAFIIKMQKTFKVKHYFWRAEPQKNGNIHFHIIFDCFVGWNHIRTQWNKIIERYGSYVSDFEDKHGHNDPNSTDVHALKKCKNVVSYIIKYCCKAGEEGQRAIKGRIWGCSDSLRNTTYYADTQEFQENDFIGCNPEMTSYIDSILKMKKGFRLIEDENFTVILLDRSQDYFLKKFSPRILEEYQDHYVQIFNDLY